MPPMTPQRIRLGATLREVRATRFASGNVFAQHIGWAQSRVSKIETAVQLPTEEDIRAWAAACGADETTVTQLLSLLAEARIEYVNARDVQRTGGLASRQVHLSNLEQQTTRLCDWQPSIIPGLLQTADYARELLHLPGGPLSFGGSTDDVEQLVAARIRRQNILYQQGKEIAMVVGEPALRNPPRLRETLHAQLDRLVAVAGLRTLTLAILPLGAAMPCLPPVAFTLHNDAYVLVETLTAETRLDESGEVKVYRECFNKLLAASAVGNDALELIRRASEVLT